MKTHLRYFLGSALALGLFAATLSPAQAFIGISVGIAPPPLPVYAQPAYPGDGYAWTPGYWAWDPDQDSYYWVPGSWVLAPEVGLLWTPCWWGWQDGAYCFHNGYWGRDVGFYGGINYGYGYNGRGFNGGGWRGNHFYANRSAGGFGGSRVSFNGGRGGVNAVATANERTAANEHHVGATRAQNAEVRSAAADPGQRFSSNHGNPAVTSSARAGSFRGTTANAATGTTHERSATGESAFTGENRTASNGEHLNRTSSANAATGERRSTGGESAFTGENRTASASSSAERERTAQASAENERRTQAASEQRRATETRTANTERTAAVERSRPSESHVNQPRVSESHVSAPSHSQSFRQASHSGGGGGGFAHASVSHSGGGGSGGAAHASASHAGGGGGGGHAAGGGGHAGGGGAHH